MNERYLFRGKTKPDGEWIYGGHMYVESLDRHIIVEHDGCKQFSDECFGFSAVIPETVGQCTGLKDKNGNWIFEGDIIEYKFEYGKIIYSESEAMYIAEFDTWCTDFDHIDSNRIEVIDNIHDNPELLEVE